VILQNSLLPYWLGKFGLVMQFSDVTTQGPSATCQPQPSGPQELGRAVVVVIGAGVGAGVGTGVGAGVGVGVSDGT